MSEITIAAMLTGFLLGLWCGGQVGYWWGRHVVMRDVMDKSESLSNDVKRWLDKEPRP